MLLAIMMIGLVAAGILLGSRGYLVGVAALIALVAVIVVLALRSATTSEDLANGLIVVAIAGTGGGISVTVGWGIREAIGHRKRPRH